MRSKHPMTSGAISRPQSIVLADLLGADEVLVARCVAPECGATAELDLGPWRLSQLRFASVARLEGELRCGCGARQGALSARAYWGPRPVQQGRLYLFNG
jgi:hypothetical protein